MAEIRDDCLSNNTQTMNDFIDCDAFLQVYQAMDIQPAKDVSGGTIIVYTAHHPMLKRVDHDNVPSRQYGQLLRTRRAGYRPQVYSKCLQFHLCGVLRTERFRFPLQAVQITSDGHGGGGQLASPLEQVISIQVERPQMVTYLPASVKLLPDNEQDV
jgi:hypothetical protein